MQLWRSAQPVGSPPTPTRPAAMAIPQAPLRRVLSPPPSCADSFRPALRTAAALVAAAAGGAASPQGGHTPVVQEQQPAPPTYTMASPPSAASYHDDVERVLYSEEQLHARIRELGKQLATDFADKAPLILGVLTGAFQFTGDLVRCMDPCPRGTTVNFIRASSYGCGTTSSGQVKIGVDLPASSIAGRHVVLVEDIVDTGLTLTRLKAHMLEECGAASCVIVTLLDKRERRKVVLEPEYVGFSCPNEFIVGFGLDWAEEYRTLPYIGVLKPHLYSRLS